MSREDTIEVEILPDGGIKVYSGAVSAPSHTSAEELLDDITHDMGGKHTIKKRAAHGRNQAKRTITQ